MPTSMRTPERMEFLRVTWPQPIEMQDILDHVNAMPGPGPVSDNALRQWAQALGVQRSPEFVAAVSSDRMRAVYVERRALGRPVESKKPGDDAIIDGWRAGLSASEIGRNMGRNKNSIIGRVHRLIDKGFLEKRPSAVNRTYHRSAPAPRPPRPERVKLGPAPPPAFTDRNVVVPKEVALRKPPPPAAITLVAATPLKMTPIVRFKGNPASMFGLRVSPLTAPVTAPYVPPSRKCAFPLWADNCKPTHKYCDKPAEVRSYCGKHARVCYAKRPSWYLQTWELPHNPTKIGTNEPRI
jgi:hypothetical protein